MTRFLSRVFDAPGSGCLNEETDRLFAYHQATKHTYDSVRANAHFLDWRNQPSAFRTFDGAPQIALPPEPGFPDTGVFAAMAALAEKDSLSEGKSEHQSEHQSDVEEEIPLDLTWLSRFLWHSMAVSAWKKVPPPGHRYSLRVNPSSGNLHPTETYLALRGFSGLGDGLYHYRADLHALELRSPGGWTQRLAQDLMIPWAAESPMMVGLTSIFWREAWKYRDRAYRYCCHDLGHATMGLLLAARALRLPGGAIAHFADARMTRALGLTGGDEAPMVFLVFPRKASSVNTSACPEETFAGIPNELSSEEMPYEWLLEMHRSTILPDLAGARPLIPPVLAEVSSEPTRDARLAEITRRRRSALDFDAGAPPMERDDLEQLLDFATRDWLADWRGNFGDWSAPASRGADLITLYLYVHRVRGCDPGVYVWDSPRDNASRLKLLHRGAVERVAAFLSLEQALAGNACFAVSMIADLQTAARIFGNRGYRYVYFEAGAIGQRLYLGAEALGWNATGIGAFYDDDVHRYLGFLEEADSSVASSLDAAEQAALVMLGSPASRHAASPDHDPLPPPSAAVADSAARPASAADSSKLPRQVIYHFAVGRAVHDPRLDA